MARAGVRFSRAFVGCLSEHHAVDVGTRQRLLDARFDGAHAARGKGGQVVTRRPSVGPAFSLGFCRRAGVRARTGAGPRSEHARRTMEGRAARRGPGGRLLG